MKPKFKVVLAVLAGIVIGAVAVQGLHAQAKPPGYFVFDNEVTDAEGYKRVVELTPASLAPYGARYLIFPTATREVLQGSPPNRFGVLAFKSMEDAQAWYNSAPMKEILPILARTSKPRSFLVEGVSN